MKKIRIALSIVVLLGTMAVVGVSGAQAGFSEEISPGVANVPPCNCVLHNPEGFGILKDGSCNPVSCYTL